MRSFSVCEVNELHCRVVLCSAVWVGGDTCRTRRSEMGDDMGGSAVCV